MTTIITMQTIRRILKHLLKNIVSFHTAYYTSMDISI